MVKQKTTIAPGGCSHGFQLASQEIPIHLAHLPKRTSVPASNR
ncbi:hypothetical protein F442_08506 [Phytophthora nicotianae P10297]|uniref:Uncharacterized protein n=2 Tax=Phytophthora nicotianae TaxID=4792 RepID=W2ZCL4_PHYNI|nr:hypothetical protein F444_08638 [Phytophthora nicotianae P1976]ETP45018.1 hypothetical protein F442_08506 [Phytophthora nicotianae P10297]